ncbi:hypothetical protein BO79DRAFT_225175 [Aspergillus costaricaensis CBS 115574]|uniref:Uncharacterized protein n=1 Tax=Aspergillus costaricaensis CBS 115574 TaxID=1448317 RepID=A0ACD1IS00_9EURO|nr:hypothetical protein BO79DRAFT_225175 [Aspergillus costaricaensis CBS 115574]RAK92883.1 hypothetical protein BO79DRAFT_225175 [Aspergillus costaricaensis CBS 115574]
MITVTGVAVADRIRQPKPIQLVNKLPAMEGKRTKTRKTPGSGERCIGIEVSAGGKPDRWMNREVQMSYDVDIGVEKSKEWAEVCKGGRTVWLVTFGQDPAGGLFFPLVSSLRVWSAYPTITTYYSLTPSQRWGSTRNRLGRLVSLHELGPGHPWPAARIHGPKQLADDPLSRN